MKKTTIVVIALIVVIIVAIVIFGGSSTPVTPGNVTVTPGNGTDLANSNPNSTTTPSVPVAVSETTKVSSKVSAYSNDELGFSIKYPTSWEKSETSNGVSLIMPIDQSQVSTVAKLQADITVTSGKCSFPPVTTVKDRGTMTVGANTLNMISMSNTVQGRNYFNRMYSLEKSSVCYTFAFSSITQSPTVKNLTGSNLTQAQNNNKAMVNTADAAFTDMVKTFAFITGPAGKDETTVVPTKK
jgi:hypothetical protein